MTTEAEVSGPTDLTQFLERLRKQVAGVATTEAENQALKAEVELLRTQVDAVRSVLHGTAPSEPKAPMAVTKAESAPWAPLAIKRERRAAIDAYLVSGKYLQQSNATIAKKFGVSKSTIAGALAELLRAGKIQGRPRGRPPTKVH